MRFFISVPENIMAIDNVVVNMDCSSLTSTRYVIWNENGSGFVEPSTGIALRTPFSDPSPYQTIIEAWMTVQAAAPTPLTLAQAQAIKNQLIGAIYLAKSQAPVSVTVGAGAFQWDATPDAITTLLGYTGEEYIPPLNALVASYDALLTWFSTFDTAIQTKINGVVSEINAAISAANSAELAATSGANGIDSFLLAQFPLSTETAPSLAGEPGSVSALTLPTISVVPHGHTTAVTITFAELRSILNAITAQRVNEQAVMNTKQAAVNALSTVSAVIALDVTSGW